MALLQAHETAQGALLQAREAHGAAKAALQQPCFLQQAYWCDGAGATVTALEAWQRAGLPFRAVVHLKAPEEGAQPQDPPALIAGTQNANVEMGWQVYHSECMCGKLC